MRVSYSKMNTSTNDGNNSPTTKSNSSKQDEWKKREIGALWKRESKASGKKYLAGHVKYNELGTEVTLKVVVFPNLTKKNEKSPDFVLYVSQEEGSSKANPKTQTATARVQESTDDVL